MATFWVVSPPEKLDFQLVGFLDNFPIFFSLFKGVYKSVPIFQVLNPHITLLLIYIYEYIYILLLYLYNYIYLS